MLNNLMGATVLVILTQATLWCSGGQTRGDSDISISDSPSDYYPLQVGNTWSYVVQDSNHKTHQLTWSVTDKKTIKDQTRFYLWAKPAEGDEPFEVCSGRNGVFECDSDRFLLRNPIKVGERWSVRLQRVGGKVSTDLFEIKSAKEKCLVDGHQFSRCVEIQETDHLNHVVRSRPTRSRWVPCCMSTSMTSAERTARPSSRSPHGTLKTNPIERTRRAFHGSSYNQIMLSAAKQESIPLLAASLLSRNAPPAHHFSTALFYPSIGFSNSNTATGLAGSLYDEGRRSRCSGKERDAESGLDYFGARYHSSALGRFTSPDEFKRNSPLRYVDPNGHDFLDYISGVANAFVSDPHHPRTDDYR